MTKQSPSQKTTIYEKLTSYEFCIVALFTILIAVSALLWISKDTTIKMCEMLCEDMGGQAISNGFNCKCYIQNDPNIPLDFDIFLPVT